MRSAWLILVYSVSFDISILVFSMNELRFYFFFMFWNILVKSRDNWNVYQKRRKKATISLKLMTQIFIDIVEFKNAG